MTLSIVTFLGGLPACASIEAGRYGVARLDIAGMQQMRSASLRDCLLTRERPKLALRLGATAPSCSEAPFDTAPPELRLWSWSWTDWPTFNPSILEQDLQRILRWYRARGLYRARVREVSLDPPSAGQGERCVRGPCTVRIRIVIEEGQPVLVQSVQLSGIDGLPADLRAALGRAIGIEPGARFDEADYDRAKASLRGALRDASFAAALVEGKVEVDANVRQARIRLAVHPGKPYVFGALRLTGLGGLPAAPVRLASGFVAGERYHPERLNEMRVEVLGLGAFSAVDVQEHVDEARGRIDVTLKLTPVPASELRLGFGLTSGANQRSEAGDLESIPQWDVHLFGSYERRHLAGTLGAVRIEERPRLIFGDVFPTPTRPELGNVLTLEAHQPGLLEARTDTYFRSSWDYGPDPFLGFTRSDVSLRLGARRGFFQRHLTGAFAVQQDLFLVGDGADNVTSDGSPTPSSYHYAFLEQDLRLDLRDQAVQPSHGAYLLVNSTEAVESPLSDWSSWRIAPDVRIYLPLPFSSVLAWRAAVGALFIFAARSELDDLSRRLGPSSYRLRGGGANSVRGFLPGELGAGTQGGLRRWESMLEWRVRFGTALTAVTFVDFGDVNDAASFRFSHLNTSVGFGVRYFTFIGPLRLDAGFRVADWQRTDGSDGIEEGAGTFPLTNVPGALHLTIGDSF